MDNRIVLIIVAIIFPPVAVYLKRGVGSDMFINMAVCVLLLVPGLVHALWIVTRQAESKRGAV